jgi:hypothetical protein
MELKYKIIRALLFGRFEPIQTVISASSFIHGIIIIGSHIMSGRSILGASPSLEVFAGLSLIASGILVVRSICKNYSSARKYSFFAQFMSWAVLSILIIGSPDIPALVYFGYATLSAIAAFLYLNLSLGAKND